MDDMKTTLLRKAYLYADAEAYRAGVEAALSAVEAQQRTRPDEGVDDDTQVVVSMTR